MRSYSYSRELNIGRAGEYLVMFDLLSKGYQAYLTDQGVAYDIVLDLGFKLIRLQVKATLKPGKMTPTYRKEVYKFNVRRSGRSDSVSRGKSKKLRQYAPDEFDAYALVTLDTQKVYYYPFEQGFNKMLLFRTASETYGNHSHRQRPCIEECTIESCLSSLGIEGEDLHFDPLVLPPEEKEVEQLNFFGAA